MDKVQDGYFAFTDSHRPLLIATQDRAALARVAFVGDSITISPAMAAEIVDCMVQPNGAVTFTLRRSENAEAVPTHVPPFPNAEAVRGEAPVDLGTTADALRRR